MSLTILFSRLFNKKLIPKAYNYQGYYFIVIGFYKDEDLKKVFEHLFRKFILNAHILVLNNKNRKEVLIYTNFPFKENNCRKMKPIIWNIFKNGKLTDKKIVFPNKVENLNGCTIEIAVFDRPPFIFYKTINNKTTISGIEGQLLNSISKKINFTLDVTIVKDKLIQLCQFQNKSTAIESISSENFKNISIGGLGITTEVYRKRYDATKAYIYVSLSFVFPLDDWETSYEKFFRPFTVNTWFSICLIFGFSAILITILKLIKRKTRIFIIGTTDTPLFDMISIFLKNPITRTATRTFARTLTIHWMLLSLIISAAYQGTLFQYLQGIDKIPIYTINELVNKGYKFVIPHYTRGLFRQIPEIYENIDLSGDNVCTGSNPVQLKRKQAVLTNMFRKKHFNMINILNYTESTSNVYLFPVSMILDKSSYLKTEFDIVIDKYLANGLIENWIGDYDNPDVIIANKEPSELTFKELLGGFQICLFFYIFSILVFCIELVSVKLSFVKKIMNWLIY